MSAVLDEQPARRTAPALDSRRIALVDLLDRVLAGGVVITGEVTLCIADVDLVRISLRALVASVRSEWDSGVGSLDAEETVR
ncbi:gas vesicle protein [Streptomyces sp. NBC_01485]|uniref:gas vesicle protein n=1 Tax=Streptomyces sp. NBC_01485 TaxID=2903884 RepID=UPI002E37F27E|nr:gas vesicle protein [Streptomyces sp. NBC_01485]